MTMKQLRIAITTIYFLLAVFACDNGMFAMTTKISDILASPSKYNEKTVTIKGKVAESLIVLNTGYFVLSDGTESIIVVPSKTFPRVGEEVKVSGQVKNAFVIGEKSLTVVEERDK
jgi:hypothetical protein